MTRRLTRADHELWDRLRETVKPLRGRRAAKPSQAAPPAPAETPERKSETSDALVATAALRRKAYVPPALAKLEEKTRRRLGRGVLEIDSRIDLHGMRQERAHEALIGFLRHAQAQGNRIVLVVTGKGKAGEEGRGVLRHTVPSWLSRPDLRSLIVGFEQAERRHGGEGALYVRIRRRREMRSRAR